MEDQKQSKGKNRQNDRNEDLYKQFHPAFCDAMTQIFEHDTCKYEYEREYNLNSMPNRIDLLVIKKRKDAVSEKGIGKIFRKYNIFEYKSPGQSLGVREYHTAMAYANLYAGYIKKVQFEELTVSFVREGKPERLLAYFRDHGFTVTMPENGIYYVKKHGHMDMQVIVTRELGDEYIWLKALSSRLKKEDAMKLTAEAGKEQEPLGKMRIRTILDLVSELNQNKTWMKEMNTMGIRDLFKEEFEEKDEQIAEQKEQIQDVNRQLRSQSEQLQSEKEEVNRLRREIEELKKQIGKIAVI